MKVKGELIHGNEDPTMYEIVIELDYTIDLGELQRFIQEDCKHHPIDRRDPESLPGAGGRDG